MFEKAPDTAKAQQETPTLSQEQLRSGIIDTLKDIYDPEIPVNIYDLGLIYDLHLDQSGHVTIQMTLTMPGCPIAESFPEIVANRVRMVPGVEDVVVDLVWDPPWTPERINEAAKRELGLTV